MDHNSSDYRRRMRSAFAEDILSKSDIYLNVPLLKMLSYGKSNQQADKLYHNCSQSKINARYYSRDKVTARLFTMEGSFNPITLSDPDIKECIVSRYRSEGVIVELDFSQFEPSIMFNLMNFSFDGDVHNIVSDKFNISRQDAKKLNNAYFYGMSSENVKKLVDVNEYFHLMSEFAITKEKYVQPHIEHYREHGYVVNFFGRKIYPRSEHTIFNNLIQSTGSDILIEAIIRIYKQNKFNIIFHRFDSLFFDMKISDVYLYLSELRNLMCTNDIPGLHLHTSVYIGNNLNKLKKLKE